MVVDQDDGTDHYGVVFVDCSYPFAQTWVIAGKLEYSDIPSADGDTVTEYQDSLNHALHQGWVVGLF